MSEPIPESAFTTKLFELTSNFLDRFPIAIFSLAYFIDKSSKASITKSAANPQVENVIPDSLQFIVYVVVAKEIGDLIEIAGLVENDVAIADDVFKTVVL